MKTQVKTSQEIVAMRQSGKILADILTLLEHATVAGITTHEIDQLARAELKKRGAKAAFLGYNGFPASICISINDEVVHGLPSQRIVKDGDLVTLDFGATYDGMITDSALTVAIGEVSAQSKKLLDYTHRALLAGIDVVKDGVRVGDIGAAIDRELVRGGLHVIDSLGGHGVGHKVHEDPIILNFGQSGTGQMLRAGMTIALEPIASLSTHEVDLADDHWTYKTVDGSLSAQFEHTILITQDGAEVLTERAL